MSKTVVFFGNERLVSGLPSTDAPLLRGLIGQGYTVAAVVSNHTESSSRNKRPLEVAEIAKEHDIPILLPDNPSDIIDQLAGYEAVAGVLSSYGRVIPQTIIDLFPKGIINLHPSLLPKYRGSTPIESAVLNGDTEAGVSIMQLVSAMDAGPVFAQATVALTGHEDKFELYNQLSKLGARLLLDKLPAIIDGSLTPTAQNEDEATFSKLFNKMDAQLDPTTLTAQEAERRVRAYLNFPKTKLHLAGHEIVVTQASISNEKETALDIEFKDGTFLRVEQLVAPNGRRMSGKDFLNGYAAA